MRALSKLGAIFFLLLVLLVVAEYFDMMDKNGKALDDVTKLGGSFTYGEFGIVIVAFAVLGFVGLRLMGGGGGNDRRR